MAERWQKNKEDVLYAGVRPVHIESLDGISMEWDDWEHSLPIPDHFQMRPNPPAVSGFLLPPAASSIWEVLRTRHSSNFLLDIFYRAKAVYNHLRTLWNDFCQWSKERQEPWGVWSAQIGYEDASEEPKWRMKQIIEFKTWKNMNVQFHAGRTNAKWTWRSSRPRAKRIVWLPKVQGDPGDVPVVLEPLWAPKLVRMAKVPPGHFTLLYFASAASYTSKDFETIEAPLPLSSLFDHLEKKYTGIKQSVLETCLVTINLDYVDMPDKGKGESKLIIKAGDEVGIIPPVSSG